MKTCTDCRRSLPLDAFYILNTGKPRPACKRCYYARTLAYKRADRQRASAHRAVARAVADGSLVKPERCRCGSTKRLNAHHEDYARPFDVSWLCGVCHSARHGNPEDAAEAA